MVDPFESLRHDAESTSSTVIDPRFRAELLDEARRRLSASSTDSIRPRVTADTPTPTQMEPITMLAKQPKKTRPTLLAAACIALVAAGVVAVVALRAEDDGPPAPAEQPPPTDSATSTPTTTVPRLSDAETAQAMLLSGDEYGPDWVGVPNGWILPSMDSTIAGRIVECAPFVDTVFGAAERGASAFRTFWHFAQPEAFSTQYVAVLPDASVARLVYEQVNSPGFASCVTAYGTVLSGGQSPGSFPSPVDQPITDPPFDPIGDLLTYRTFSHTWHTADGIEMGPQTDIDAVMLVGRTITFIGTVTEGEGGVVLNTTDQFQTALEHIVERTNAALA
jgi:hypothetical protein